MNSFCRKPGNIQTVHKFCCFCSYVYGWYYSNTHTCTHLRTHTHTHTDLEIRILLWWFRSVLELDGGLSSHPGGSRVQPQIISSTSAAFPDWCISLQHTTNFPREQSGYESACLSVCVFVVIYWTREWPMNCKWEVSFHDCSGGFRSRVLTCWLWFQNRDFSPEAEWVSKHSFSHVLNVVFWFFFVFFYLPGKL